MAAPLALIGGRIRTVWVVLTWLMHVTIAALMFVVFPYPLFAVAFAPFYNLERLAAAGTTASAAMLARAVRANWAGCTQRNRQIGTSKLALAHCETCFQISVKSLPGIASSAACHMSFTAAATTCAVPMTPAPPTNRPTSLVMWDVENPAS
jgi:hypothetical protein